LISNVAAGTASEPERDLATAFSNHRKVVSYRRFDIQATAEAYYQVFRYDYAVQLALERAEKMDEGPLDGFGDPAAEIQKCYNLVTDTLGLLYNGSAPEMNNLRHDDLEQCLSEVRLTSHAISASKQTTYRNETFDVHAHLSTVFEPSSTIQKPKVPCALVLLVLAEPKTRRAAQANFAVYRAVLD
jgi:hypothetical protein